jgi:hypothetical protein
MSGAGGRGASSHGAGAERRRSAGLTFGTRTTLRCCAPAEDVSVGGWDIVLEGTSMSDLTLQRAAVTVGLVSTVVTTTLAVALNWSELRRTATDLRRWWNDPVYRRSAPELTDPPGYSEAHRQLYDDIRVWTYSRRPAETGETVGTDGWSLIFEDGRITRIDG